MRVAIITESFLPTTNGVTNSVCHVLDFLRDNGHEAIVICPSAGAPSEYAGFPVYEVPALVTRKFPVGIPTAALSRVLLSFRPDVVHVASPFMLGFQALTLASRMRIPSVAIYQTDIAGFVRRNRIRGARRLTWAILRMIHNLADVTLAPSTSSILDLRQAGIDRVSMWGRGVDNVRFHPRNRFDERVLAERERLAPDGEVIVGYVGRLAPEKQIERLARLEGVGGIKIVVVGDGPSRASLQKTLRRLPVEFTGQLRGDALDRAYATFDVFAHTGTEETFGQTLQEAKATGLPVVAPRAGGPIDIVKHGVTGLLFDPNSPSDHDFRTSVLKIVRDPILRARMGEAARRSVADRTWTSLCQQLVGHYETAVAHAHDSADRDLVELTKTRRGLGESPSVAKSRSV